MQAWRGQGGRASTGKGQDMTTPRNRAIYKAKQDFAIMRTHGRPGGLIRLDTEDGARWSYTDSESGFVVILKHAADYRELGGAVDAARTRDANVARVKEEMRAARLAEVESGPVGPDWQGMGADSAFYAQAPARPDGKPGPFAFGPSEAEARARLAAMLAKAEAAPAEEPKPAPAAVRYIDATPTWAAILPALLAAVTDGTAEGQRIARAELARMARAADSAVEMERHAAEARRAAYHDTARAAGI